MIDHLRKLVEKNIEISNDVFKLERLKYIKKIMSDENIFFKITIEEAYSIFRDLGIKESDYKELYIQLLNSK